MPSAIASRRARTAELFHALSDETRLAILDELRAGEQCVCDLMDCTGAAQSRLSFHLRVLKDAGLVDDRKEGRWSYYRLIESALTEMHDRVVDLVPGVTAVGKAKRRLALAIGSCCG
jgi:ArsR family transcriptional regulator, arsenate/arsenite/antimonite-responsive transcriptional repressor